MINMHDNLLRTDAINYPIDEMLLGRHHLPTPAAGDTDDVLAATARVKKTEWVAATCVVKAASNDNDKLTVKAPAMFGDKPNKLKIDLKTNTVDALEVTASGVTITIKLAKTTESKNTAANCQTAIRALKSVDGINVTAFTCSAASNWDSAAKATGETAAVSFSNGATGDYDVYVVDDIEQPDVPRNLVAKSGGTSGDIANVAVNIIGTDIDDRVIEEELPYFTADSSTTVTGTKAFKTIKEVWLPAHDGDAATTEIGYGVKFGVPFKMKNKIIRTRFDGAWETTEATVVTDDNELSKNTVQIAGHASLDGEKDVDIIFFL